MVEPKAGVDRQHFQLTAVAPVRAIDLLATETGLSRSELKRAMNAGAVWLQRQGRKRLRRATAELRSGERIDLFYDPKLLAAAVPKAELVADERGYSLWYKPPGLVAQGSDWGDQLSLLRQVEQRLNRPTLLVHRIDREAAGLMVVAHDRQNAAALSRLFSGDGVQKRYRIEILGDIAASHGASGVVETPLDGRRAVTRWQLVSHDSQQQRSILEVAIDTGRYHQIRRHMAGIGHPVMGDPRYGQGNKNREGLRLLAVALAFRCPRSGQVRQFELSPARIPF